MKAQNFERLITDFGKHVGADCPLPEYPRPQMVRDSYVNLNGTWQYAIVRKGTEPKRFDGTILVPFSPESILSGVERTVTPEDELHYARTFVLDASFLREKTLLHFGAVDYRAEVFVNDVCVGTHKGGYDPFCFDVTEVIRAGENKIYVKVTDPSDTGPQSRGKQKIKRGGIFYTPQSGIWQTVWMESVPADYIRSIRFTPDIDTQTLSVEIEGGTGDGSYAVTYKGIDVVKGEIADGKAVVPMQGAKLWSPETPELYDIELRSGKDVVRSYFGMRKFSTGKDADGIMRLMLNNKPYFHNGLLDQGYWSDGLYTPPSDEAMIFDIATAKKMGFNMLRKHIKIEPLRWYYHCDRLGMLVWQDMVNGGGKANTPLNGICGFLGITPKDSNYRLCGRTDEEGRKEYYIDTERTVKTLYNSVSVCLWVPFNESWGQFDALKATEFVRRLDPTRPIDHASGWHDQGGGDFVSLHIYFRKVFLPKPDPRVYVLSEFGGYSVKVEGHVFNKDKSFGYRKYPDLASFDDAYHALYNNEILPLIPKGLSATVYTQLTDVEDEINGLLTYDRKVVKLDLKRLQALNETINRSYDKAAQGGKR